MLRGISLQHFALLKSVRIGLTAEQLLAADSPQAVQNLSHLRPLNALIGRNSTGKSSLFSALSFISDTLQHGVAFASSQRGRGGFARLLTDESGDEMRFTLLFEARNNQDWLQYQLTFERDSFSRPAIAAEQVTSLTWSDSGWQTLELLDVRRGAGSVYSPKLGRESVELTDNRLPALAVYGRILQHSSLCWLYSRISRWYVCDIDGETVPRQQESGGHRHLNPACNNLRNVLNFYEQDNPDAYRKMLRRITEKIPGLKKVGDAQLDRQMTSGNRRLFTFLLLLEDPRPRPLICLDDPDVGLYHDMVDTLAQALRDYTLRNPACQILLTTHNLNLLESFRPDEVFAFRRSRDSEDQDRITVEAVGEDPLVQAMYDEGVGMGALWYGGHFNDTDPFDHDPG